MLKNYPKIKQTQTNQSKTPKDQNPGTVCSEKLRVTDEMLIFLNFLTFNKILQTPDMVCLETRVLLASNKITNILNGNILIMWWNSVYWHSCLPQKVNIFAPPASPEYINNTFKIHYW